MRSVNFGSPIFTHCMAHMNFGKLATVVGSYMFSIPSSSLRSYRIPVLELNMPHKRMFFLKRMQFTGYDFSLYFPQKRSWT